MTIVVNGTPREVEHDLTVVDLVRWLGRDPEQAGTAIARNGDVVARGDWHETRLADGDAVEVLTAVAGG